VATLAVAVAEAAVTAVMMAVAMAVAMAVVMAMKTSGKWVTSGFVGSIRTPTSSRPNGRVRVLPRPCSRAYCPMVVVLWQTSVVAEHPARSEMFLIQRVRVAVESHRNVYARSRHLSTNCVSSNGPTNSIEA